MGNETIATGARAAIELVSNHSTSYPFVPGGTDKIPAEVVSWKVDAPNLVDVEETRSDRLVVTAKKPGTVRLEIKAKVAGRKTKETIVLRIENPVREEIATAANPFTGALKGVEYSIPYAAFDANNQSMIVSGKTLAATPAPVSSRENCVGGWIQLMFGEVGTKTLAAPVGTITVVERADATLAAIPGSEVTTSAAAVRLTHEGVAIAFPRTWGDVRVVTPEICEVWSFQTRGPVKGQAWLDNFGLRPAHGVVEGRCTLQLTFQLAGQRYDAEHTLEVAELRRAARSTHP